jgi:hypothetical protein
MSSTPSRCRLASQLVRIVAGRLSPPMVPSARRHWLHLVARKTSWRRLQMAAPTKRSFSPSW